MLLTTSKRTVIRAHRGMPPTFPNGVIPVLVLLDASRPKVEPLDLLEETVVNLQLG